MLEAKELSKKLESLAQLDVDAVHAYDSAVKNIDIEDVKNQLVAYRDDHKRHISDLSPLIEKFGGKPPTMSPDFKGFVIQGFTAIRSATGTEGALKAMKGNEELTNKTYDDALKLELPSDVREVVERNRDDERRHLSYIEKCLSERVYEKNVA